MQTETSPMPDALGDTPIIGMVTRGSGDFLCSPDSGIPSEDMAATAALLFVSLIAIFVHNSEAIHCYVCSSDVDRSCSDPFNKTSRRFLVSDCERDRSFTPYLRGNAVCRKFTHIVNDELVIVRSCAWGSESDVDGPCSPSALNYAKKIESCMTCNTNECNSSPNLASLTMMIVLPLAMLVSRFL